MSIRYIHTNIISQDWKKLADFYIQVFGCTQAMPKTHLSGDWVAKGTGVKDADFEGIHLQLPGYDKNGPTLEIFQYTSQLNKPTPPAANRQGLGHLAFHVDDIEAALAKLLDHGGHKLGGIVSKEFKPGTLTFVYTTDPENNIIELQTWKPKS